MTERSVTPLRARFACALVRWASRWWQASCDAHEITGRGGAFWDAGAKRVDRFALGVAKRLDYHATTEQMAEECWWG